MSVSGQDRPTGVQYKRLAVQHTQGDKERGIGPTLELSHVVALKINVVINLGAENASKCAENNIFEEHGQIIVQFSFCSECGSGWVSVTDPCVAQVTQPDYS